MSKVSTSVQLAALDLIIDRCVPPSPISTNLITPSRQRTSKIIFLFSPPSLPTSFRIVRLTVEHCPSLLSLFHMICPFRHPSPLIMIISVLDTSLDTTALSALSLTVAINYFKSLPPYSPRTCVIVEHKKNPILHLLVSVYS